MTTTRKSDRRSTGRTAGLLLAAGAGRRYGMPKALVRRGERPLVEWAARTLREGGCAPVVVVLGAAAEEVHEQADLLDALIVDNPDWPTGMGSSLRAGLAALAATDAESTVVLLVDTPGITPAAVRRLTAAGSTTTSLAVATYHGERGHPVLLGREHWPGVAELAVGDVGARPYLRRHQVREIPCADIADGRDIDTNIDVPTQDGGR
ncbi:MAG TPA: nucleotidyltransferase family protein [Pseudonocardiaceae bacterium]|nr:nucleotidyltransferase family protein [Pseudonocardiaceae bacterium]